MLVLTRKLRESIRIGDDVTVTVLSIHGNKIRIGIQAPREVPVNRTELLQVLSELPIRPPPVA